VAKDEILQVAKGAKLEVLELDLSSLSSVRKAAKTFLASGRPLHYLVNNAGVMQLPDYSASVDGLEMQFAVNYVGHWLLTELLLGKLKESAPSRIVTLSSLAHLFVTRSQIDELLSSGSLPLNASAYDEGLAYGISKAANALHAKDLGRRLEGTGVQAFAVHPGIVNTELARYNFGAQLFYDKALPFFEAITGKKILKSVPQGAATTIYCMTANASESVGGYYADSMPGEPQKGRMNMDVIGDVKLAEELNSYTANLVKKLKT